MKKNSKIILKVEASTNFIKEDDISKSSKDVKIEDSTKTCEGQIEKNQDPNKGVMHHLNKKTNDLSNQN